MELWQYYTRWNLVHQPGSRGSREPELIVSATSISPLDTRVSQGIP